MATPKFTIIVGRTTNLPSNWDAMSINERYDWTVQNPLTSCHRNGHWKNATIINLAKKLGIIEEVSVTHSTLDPSGKGRGVQSHFKINLN